MTSHVELGLEASTDRRHLCAFRTFRLSKALGARLKVLCPFCPNFAVASSLFRSLACVGIAAGVLPLVLVE
jgi:hypothetical protein